METHGVFSPATEAAAREQYEDIGPAAQTVVKETAKAMRFDSEEYGERVTSDVVSTARDALFATLLETHTGTTEEFDADVPDDFERHVEGSENVDNVAWHVAPAAETVVAVTYHEKEEAAIGTLQRIAFGRVYRDIV
ncbi:MULTISPECIES: DUF5809 family protein [unclassified Haladaptatus]|uniref:DUF5809 family protein n=1 Tax=unclassified Haladaptatus TaxID=2622732 RepID=UPI00209C09D2|nr:MULTISPECIES: DUF5809 family protein [unclassified Haladaptatus]MCO8246914.1 DUF5809 family protein [Haladaptatus sp. AB643]MCO8253560.1 DUF5809 family protein [Haladaptatus sp. AB618]